MVGSIGTSPEKITHKVLESTDCSQIEHTTSVKKSHAAARSEVSGKETLTKSINTQFIRSINQKYHLQCFVFVRVCSCVSHFVCACVCGFFQVHCRCLSIFTAKLQRLPTLDQVTL